MTRILPIALTLVAFASAASAVTLTVQPDKLTYNVGETVLLTVTGDPQSGKDSEIYGRLEYSAALTDTVTSSQTEHTREGGTIPAAVVFPLETGDGFAEVFVQIIEPNLPRTVDQLQIATATLVAEAVGTVSVTWPTGALDPIGLDFFGLTSAPGASFTIVPEPGTIALLGLGLAALVAGRRRR